MSQRTLFVLMLTAVGVSGCTTPTSPTRSAPAANIQATQTATAAAPKTAEEARSRLHEIAIPDLQQFAELVEQLQRESPAATDDELRTMIWTRLAAARVEDRLAARTYLGVRVTDDEYVLLFMWPNYVKTTWDAKTAAERAANAQWPGSQTDTKGDAFRHAYWTILLSKRVAEWWAVAFTDAHESETPDSQARRMDLNNNFVGLGIYQRNRGMSDSALSTTLKKYRYTYSTNIRYNTYSNELLYIRR